MKPLRRIGVLLLVLGLLSSPLWILARLSVPDFEEVRSLHQSSDRLLLDRQGRLLHQLRVDAQGRRLRWTEIDKISPLLVEALLEAEDEGFWQHSGIEVSALLAAGYETYVRGRRRGGSTISMQLVSLLDPAKDGASLRGKIEEALRALLLETRWSKEQVLEAYLNLVSFRGELQGISAASHGLFSRAPDTLGWTESAALAALIRSPNAAPEEVVARAARLAEQLGWSFEARNREDLLERLRRPYWIELRADRAPHLARVLLAGTSAGSVRSTLDLELQTRVSELVQEHLSLLRGQNVQDAAVLVVENESASVLAYVGNGGEWSSARHVDGIRAPRQVGSTLKPLLYGLAFEKRLLTPASLLADEPAEFAVAGGLYRPQNYDRRFRGLVTARVALASSLNIPAVRVLDLLQVEPFLRLLRDLGIESLREAEFYGPSLALGSADISLRDLVEAYVTLARGGEHRSLSARFDQEDRRVGSRVFSEETAFLIGAILSDRESRSTTFGLESVLSTPYWSAVKTGTSKDMRDNWCIGYSRRYTVGVWVGNFSGESMWNVSGMSGAAPLWAEVMDGLHRRGVLLEAPAAPPGVVRRWVKNHGTEGSREEWFLEGTESAEIQPAATNRPARISYPLQGVVVAHDPDIPPRNQWMFLESDPQTEGYLWELNGELLGDASSPLPWKLRAGKHLLLLRDRAERVVDRVEFFVRSPNP